jgi:small nuclear ribonucleoprotein (snRNP)-like protein
MDPSRPLDALNNNRDKTVIVELKNGRVFRGILKSFDIHINTVLFSAEELKEDAVLKKVGTLFIRGDAILTINPEE